MKLVFNPLTGKFDLVVGNTDHHAGWSKVNLNENIRVVLNKISKATKFEKQTGFIKQSGFIRGNE